MGARANILPNMAKRSSTNAQGTARRGAAQSESTKSKSPKRPVRDGGAPARSSGGSAASKPKEAPALEGQHAAGDGPRLWLFKSEPEVFSFQDLLKAPKKRTGWDGVRNYQARNFLRDDCKVGDLVVYWHSNAEPPHGAGIAKVVRSGHPDPTQFIKGHDHEDPDSDPADPRWMQVEIEAVRAFEKPVTLEALRADPRSKGMLLLAKGQRLSIQPLTRAQYELVLELGGG